MRHVSGKASIAAALVSLVLLLPSSAEAQSDDAVTWSAANFDGYDVTTDVAYLTANNYELKLDIYMPRGLTAPNPTLVYMHAGGWVIGNKEGAFLFALPFLVKGWTVVNVGYRLAAVSPAPAAVEDCRCALRWIVHNAEKYKIDPKRIVLMGHSAGGHLALTTGMLPVSAGLDRQCAYLLPSLSRAEGEPEVPVAAIINWFGITDVADVLVGPNVKSYAVAWLGSQPNRMEVAERVSPLQYVRGGVPPVLTIHGDADGVVPYSHATRLHQALTEAGVSNQLLTIPGGGHGNFGREENVRIYEAIWRFLDEYGGIE